MKVLIDTNIFIYREDEHIVPQEIQKLFRILHARKISISIHPSSRIEIEKDKDPERREITLSKIEAYPQLEQPPIPHNEELFSKIIGPPKSKNDEIDNLLLFSAYKYAVDILITNDMEILKKASQLNIEDRVHTIQSAISSLQLIKEKKIPPLPFLITVPVHNLDVNDPIFRSLKLDYPEFEKWFKKISVEDRKALVHFKPNEEIGALLIYKFEEDSIDSDPVLPRKKRLKICTMIVSRTGYRIGELLIRKSIQIALINNIYEIYLTHFVEPNDLLVTLIEEFGFFQSAYLKNVTSQGIRESIFIKQTLINFPDGDSFTPISIAKSFFPSFYDGESVNKYIIPIQPKFHNQLFIESKKGQNTLDDFLGILHPEGNTIKKAYLSGSSIKGIQPGDIILFYRSRDVKSLTTIGIVENAISTVQSIDEAVKLIWKRTVYSLDEINEYVRKRNFLIILFLMYFHLPRPIRFQKLIEEGILKGPPQTISRISHDNYLWIKGQSLFDVKYTRT